LMALLRKSYGGWPQVTFNLSDPDHRTEIAPTRIGKRGLMNHMIKVCARSKERSLRLFPVESPNDWRSEIFPELTREVFAEAIGGVVSVWLWIASP